MLSDSLVKSNFDRALSLMDHAVQGTLVPGMRENIAYFITSERYYNFEVCSIILSMIIDELLLKPRGHHQR